MAQVDLKLIHSQSHDYKARGSVTLSRGLELGDEEKLMEDNKAGDSEGGFATSRNLVHFL